MTPVRIVVLFAACTPPGPVPTGPTEPPGTTPEPPETTPPPPSCDRPEVLVGDLVLAGDDAQATLDASCAAPSALLGSLTVRNVAVVELVLDCLCSVGGDAVFDDNAALVTIVWDAPDVVVPIGGDLVIERAPDLAHLGVIGSIGGDLVGIDVPGLATLDVGPIDGNVRWSAADAEAGASLALSAEAIGGDLEIGPLPPGFGVTVITSAIGGDVAVSSAGEVTLDGVVSIGGDLDLVDSAGLVLRASELDDVAGGIHVSEVTGAVLDWSTLSHVGGDLRIADSADLTVLGGLSALAIDGSFVVERLAATPALQLPVSTVGRHLEVRDNPNLAELLLALHSVAGDVVVEANPALVELDTSTVTVGGDLRFRDGADGGVLITGPFTGVVPGDLEIDTIEVDPDGVCDIVEVVGDFELTASSFCIGRSSYLETVGGDLHLLRAGQSPLDDLTAIGGDLILEDTLGSSFTFKALTTIGGTLVVTDTHDLVWVTLPLLTGVSGIEVVDNIGLVGVPEILSIHQIASIEAVNNTNLVTLSGLTNLWEAGTIELVGNPLLVTLSGLDQLQTADVLWLEDNDALFELDAPIGTLEEIGELHILDNASLSDMEIDTFVAGIPTIGALFVEGNGPP